MPADLACFSRHPSIAIDVDVDVEGVVAVARLAFHLAAVDLEDHAQLDLAVARPQDRS